MIDTSDDADLVARHLAGDRSGFAAIYDRYADRLYDTAAAMTGNRHDAADLVHDVFVTAAERLGQLRDPSKLKPWLFAILRNEVYRRGRARRRAVPTDFSDPVTDVTAPIDPEGSRAEFEELAVLVRAAAAGLDARDQLVLELSLRQGLEGDDLAAALGVSAQQSYGLVHRMRQRTERSLGAYCVARAGRRDCAVLDELLAGWDGEFSVLIRKRVARHVDSCSTCERSRSILAPFPLFGAAPILVAPLELRDRVLGAIGGGPPTAGGAFDAPGGFPSPIRHGRRLGAWTISASIVLVLGTAGGLVALSSRPDSLEIAGAPALVESTTTPATGDPERTVAPTDPGTDPPDPTSAGSPPGTGSTSASPTSTSPTSASPPGTSPPGTSPPSAVPTATVPTGTVPTGTVPTGTAPPTSIAPPTSTAPPTSSTTLAPPGELSASSGSIDFGATANRAEFTLSNPGGRSVNWTADQLAAVSPFIVSPTTGSSLASSSLASSPLAISPFTVSPASGTLEPGATTTVTVTIDRTWPIEGPLPDARIRFSGPDTAAEVLVRGTIARPPAVQLLDRPPATTCVWNDQAFSWRLAIADESLPITAQIEIIPPGGGRVTVPLAPNGDWFGWTSGDHDGDPNGVVDIGVHTWTVVAKDRFGNATRVGGSTTVVDGTQNC